MKEVKRPQKPLFTFYIIIIAVVMVFNILLLPAIVERRIEEVDYGTFLKMLDAKSIQTVQVETDYIYFTAGEGDTLEQFKTATFNDQDLVDRLYASGCTFGQVVQESQSPIAALIFNWVLPILIFMLIGQFIKNIGGLPCSYVFMALFADVLDHVEWKNGFRCDGISMSIYNTIAVASVGICTGVFNLILSKSGYVAPYLDAAGKLIAVQSESVKSAITFTFVGLETITGIVLAILLLFLNVEKNIAKEQEEIKQRNGETTE